MTVEFSIKLAKLKTIVTMLKTGGFFTRRKAKKELLRLLDYQTLEKFIEFANHGHRQEAVKDIIEEIKRREAYRKNEREGRSR